MVRILLDHCVPRPFRKHFPSHEVKTTRETGWDTLKNGALLAEAGKQFDVMITVDKNLKREQSLTKLPVAIVVLDSLANTPDALVPFFRTSLKPSGPSSAASCSKSASTGKS